MSDLEKGVIPETVILKFKNCVEKENIAVLSDSIRNEGMA